MNERDYFELALACDDQSGKSTLVVDYEAELAAFFDATHAVALNSGTAAIEAALLSLGAGPGAQVAVSAAAPLPTLMPILATGADPLFIDSQPDSVALSVDDLRSVVSQRVAAVVEVPLWGYGQDYSLLQELLASRRIPLVVDAAHAHGAVANDRAVGTEGAVGCFSTHQMKVLSTGEGGFALTGDAELAASIRKYSRIGALDGISAGRNFKPSAFTAAVGLGRLVGLSAAVWANRGRALEALRLLPDGLSSEIDFEGSPNGYNLVLDMRGHSALRVTSFVRRLAASDIRVDAVRYNYSVGYNRPLTESWRRPTPNAARLIPRLVQLPTRTKDPAWIAETVTRAWKECQ